MIREAIVLAGGKGTRLKGVIDDIPKVMAPINDRPFLEYLLDYLDKWTISTVVISVGYKKEMIMDHFGDKYKSVNIKYAKEEKPLGTGGGIMHAFKQIDGVAAFVFNGDTYFDLNLERLNDFRWKMHSNVNIILRYEVNAHRFGLVEYDENNRITGFYEKNHGVEEGYINGGVYLLNKEYMQKFDFPESFSIEKDFFQKYYKTEDFYVLRCFSYFRDIGVPEDYQKAQDEFKRLIY